MAEFGAEPFRARQLWHWIYHRGATDFAAMTTLAKGFREQLAARYELRRPAVATALVSADGTRKWLLRFADGQEVETVHIPESDRGTLCVSSQVGCTLTCTLLPYRHAAPGAQPRRGRDRRPGHAGARCARRMAVAARTTAS